MRHHVLAAGDRIGIAVDAEHAAFGRVEQAHANSRRRQRCHRCSGRRHAARSHPALRRAERGYGLRSCPTCPALRGRPHELRARASSVLRGWRRAPRAPRSGSGCHADKDHAILETGMLDKSFRQTHAAVFVARQKRRHLEDEAVRSSISVPRTGSARPAWPASAASAHRRSLRARHPGRRCSR